MKQPKQKVLDSWALLAYFEGSLQGNAVTELLKEAAGEKHVLSITSVNWGEVLYVAWRRYGEEKKNIVENMMEQMPLEVVPADKTLTRQAAYFKAIKKLPYSDSFCAALAYLKKAELVTGDRDFKPVEDKIAIQWL